MSRLIDADKLMAHVKEIHIAVDMSKINTDYDTGFHSATSQIQGLIDTMPTAYDIDKVVEQLEELKKAAYESCGVGEGFVAMCNAINIVKEGGAE